MTLMEKIELLRSRSNEIAFGWDDSGCFWRFCYGNRGAGVMLESCGNFIDALDAETFEEAVDHFLEITAQQVRGKYIDE